MIGIDATGFSEESVPKRFSHVGHHARPGKCVNSTIIVFGREDDIISEDINVETVYTITTAYASSNQTIEEKALDGEC
jgi:hypothetical protein